MNKSSLILVGTAAVAAAAVGMIGFSAVRRSMLKRELKEQFECVSDFTDSDTQDHNHIPCPDNVNPDELWIKKEGYGEAGVWLTLRLNNVVATCSCKSPDWNRSPHHMRCVRDLAVAHFWQSLQASGRDKPEELTEELRLTIKRHLSFLLGVD